MKNIILAAYFDIGNSLEFKAKLQLWSLLNFSSSLL
jgi:hypothetical protein